MQRSSTESPILLAGWVFADLLLSLSVIFLASISLQNGKVDSTNPNDVDKQAKNVSTLVDTSLTVPNKTGLTLTYAKFDAAKLQSDIQKLSASVSGRVLYLQAIGGYDPKSEYSDQGSLRATEFVIGLKKSKIQNFDRASIDISTSASIPSGSVMLRLAFAP